MATRRNKSGKFTRTKRRRKSQPKFDILGASQSVILASAVSQGMFGMPIMPFLTEGWGSPTYHHNGLTTSISLPDMFERLIPGGSTGKMNAKFPDIMDSIKSNLQSGGGTMALQLIGVPIMFSVAKSILRKPILLPANRMLKSAGVKAKLG